MLLYYFRIIRRYSKRKDKKTIIQSVYKVTIEPERLKREKARHKKAEEKGGWKIDLGRE